MIDPTGLVVVDTDVISYVFKDHQLAPEYRSILNGRPLAMGRFLAPFQSCSRIVRRLDTFADAWIAAAAMQLNVPLVSHNVSDYAGIEGLSTLTIAKRQK